ncbi:MAG TPA: protein translocase subunit SecD [Sphingomonadaceae bacterium]|nr:protein translocase subunit SecD [Sphingomonadaceae bacterium]
MLDFPPLKTWSIILVLLAGVIFSIPSLMPEAVQQRIPVVASMPRFNLGLDLSGGSHILLEADINDLIKQEVLKKEEEVRTEMRRGEPRVDIGDISTNGGRLSFFVRDVSQLDTAVERARRLTNAVGVTGQRDWNVTVVDSTRIVMTPTKAGLAKATDDAMNVATEVVRKRIDEIGTKEPTIIREGSDRIVVQVPGLQNPDALKSLLGKTAKLDFKLVDLTADPAAVAAGRAPPGSEIYPFAEGQNGSNRGGTGNLAVKRLGGISGDELIDATLAYDQQGQPVVSIRFNSSGGRKFARLTQENVGKPFAMILDGKVLSAPRINEPILGGQAQISGNFTVDSANELAVALRSGKLPVALKVIEERTVGPDLGADSIRAGAIASVVAIVAVVAFMLVTYGRFGIYANIALVLNAFLILGVMAIMGATLTLPGIAGFVLTIGAAVDANVLINERIREEQRKGRSLRQSIENGYTEASRAIFDANITNVIAAAFMFFFGSGPIKGFAVVLSIGVITSVFTAVTVTRLMVARWVHRRRPTVLVI